jgi:hypothetical protein
MFLDNRPESILQNLKTNMTQMSTPTNPPVKLTSSKEKIGNAHKELRGGEGELPRYIHKLQVWTTNQLYFWSVEKTVIVLTDEPGVVDSFLC